MADLIEIFATPQIQMIVILIAVDVVLGILAALLKKDFILGKLAGFMMKPVLGYVFGFAVLVMVGQALPGLTAVAEIAYFLIVLALIGSILDNLAKLGVPIPKILRK
jgi:phage-related holin